MQAGLSIQRFQPSDVIVSFKQLTSCYLAPYPVHICNMLWELKAVAPQSSSRYRSGVFVKSVVFVLLVSIPSNRSSVSMHAVCVTKLAYFVLKMAFISRCHYKISDPRRWIDENKICAMQSNSLRDALPDMTNLSDVPQHAR